MRPDIGALVARSNRLGSSRRITNYGGGNTSAKVTIPDPITGGRTEVLAVKGPLSRRSTRRCTRS